MLSGKEENILRKGYRENPSEYIEAAEALLKLYYETSEGPVSYIIGRESDHQGSYGNIIINRYQYDKKGKFLRKNKAGEIFTTYWHIADFLESAGFVMNHILSILKFQNQTREEQLAQLEKENYNLKKENIKLLEKNTYYKESLEDIINDLNELKED